MLRSRRFTVFAFALVTVLLTLIIAEERSAGAPEEVTGLALAYAAQQAAPAQPSLRLQRLVRADQPGKLTAAMSRATFADSVFYQTSNGLAQGTPATGRRAIPYPARNLWCAYLGVGDQPASVVILIGEHHDIYNADYIVHELVDSASALAQVGCPPSP